MTDVNPNVTTAGVIGGGTMGVGIAYVFAEAGVTVTVVEPNAWRAAQVMESIANRADKMQSEGRLRSASARDLQDRLSIVESISALPLHLDLVIEAVPEDLDLKRAVLADAQEREPTLLASNTSSLGIASLASVLHRRQNFIGLHFFNPVWSMPLLEIVRGADTAEDVVRAATAIGGHIGKETVVVQDVPGFATSRLGVAIGLEAIRMVEDGVASAEDIDRAMVLGYRHPMGPLRLTDLVGLDVRLDIAHSLSRALGDRFTPPKLLVDMVAKGDLGKKTGRGFFEWPQS
jgi:3-hydroxybutyryl-CoA dehydrogenase